MRPLGGFAMTGGHSAGSRYALHRRLTAVSRFFGANSYRPRGSDANRGSQNRSLEGETPTQRG